MLKPRNLESVPGAKCFVLVLLEIALLLSGFLQGRASDLQSPQPARSAADHWAFQAPLRPEIPKVKNSKWVRNPIDAFVARRLEKEGIKPSPEADRPTLIRRLSLDLLGLPPTLEEVKGFMNDRNPNAYELLVDRLLASPHFGERWGRHWLDLAHYADSDGYEKDGVRPYAYLFRDWVIDAINKDMPFDEFTLEQIAGDLLPNATGKQKLATGFQRQTLTNKEGGVDQEEFRCKATVDRVSTLGGVWLGLTLGCAECHSHKYDPISQREFYQLYAFFNNASEKDIPAPQPAELARYQAEKKVWDAEHARRQAALDTYLKNELPTKLADWEKTVDIPEERWIVLEPGKAEIRSGSQLVVKEDKTLMASGKAADTDSYTVEVAGHELHGVTGFRLEVFSESEKRPAVGRSKTGNFVLTHFAVKLQPKEANESIPIELTNAVADFSEKDFSPADTLKYGKEKKGWAVVPQTNQTHAAVFETRQPLDIPADAKLIFTLDQEYGGAHNISRFRLAATASKAPLKPNLMPDHVVVALQTPRIERTPEQEKHLANYFGEQVDPGARKLRDQIAAHAKKEPKFPETKAAILAADSRKTQIHIRGDFLRKGEEVQPATPAVLHPLKIRTKPEEILPTAQGERSTPGSAKRSGGGLEGADCRPNRLDLANWLIDPANPLTARVTVNQVWRNLFGRGLVASVNDFGTRGEKPSHPELLDWLAMAFSGPKPEANQQAPPQMAGCAWSRKALIKLIVTSATYRQSSRSRPELTGRDPNNILLARQSRFRLEAESIRDVYLAASGLLNPAIGGPSIRPHLPADIAALGYANSVKWQESEGTEQYRRGLYIFFQRTVPYPMLMTFDAPDSNVTCTRRERSNTPLQALTLLNDPIFFQCAQALGKWVAAMPGTEGNRIKSAFQMCLGRAPSQAETDRLLRLYRDYTALLKDKTEKAATIAGEKNQNAPDLIEEGSLVALSRVIMNLDEFVTRD